MRLFLAVELGTATLDALEQAIAPLRAEAPDIAWVRPEKRHLTLKFLGHVDETRVDAVTELTERVARDHRPFSMQLAGIGAFPNFRRARVVWIGVEHEARLELLHHDFEVAAETVGFELEGRAFRPHISLSRVRSPVERDHAKRFARVARRIDFSTTTYVSEITLFESIPAPSGAHYRRLLVASLGGR